MNKRQFLLEKLTAGVWHETTANQYLDVYEEQGLDQDALGAPMFKALAVALMQFHLEQSIDHWTDLSENARAAFRRQTRIAIASADLPFAHALERTDTMLAVAAGETELAPEPAWVLRNTGSDFGRVHDLFVNDHHAGLVDEDFADGCDIYDAAGTRLNDEPLTLADAQQMLLAATVG